MGEGWGGGEGMEGRRRKERNVAADDERLGGRGKKEGGKGT